MRKFRLALLTSLAANSLQSFELKPLPTLHSTPQELIDSAEDDVLNASQAGLQEFRLRLKATHNSDERRRIKPIFELYRELFQTQKTLILSLPKGVIPTRPIRAEINRLRKLLADKETQIRNHPNWAATNHHLPAWRQADHLYNLNTEFDQIQTKIREWEELFPYRHKLLATSDPKFQLAETLRQTDDLQLQLELQHAVARSSGNTPELAHQINFLHRELDRQLAKADRHRQEIEMTQKSLD